MSSRPALIAGIVVGALAGLLVLAAALALVAVDGLALSGSMMALVILGSLGCWVLDGTWLAFASERLMTLPRGGDAEQGGGGDGRGGPSPPSPGPRPPSGDADWWPDFERDLQAHLEANERTPVAD
ncbi:MAG: hypothetical protein ACRDMX_16030 [Solirubrobacteraceae bacterium]